MMRAVALILMLAFGSTGCDKALVSKIDSNENYQCTALTLATIDSFKGQKNFILQVRKEWATLIAPEIKESWIWRIHSKDILGDWEAVRDSPDLGPLIGVPALWVNSKKMLYTFHLQSNERWEFHCQ
jgi:hypothetical protein